jgi:hypothetical protein
MGDTMNVNEKNLVFEKQRLAKYFKMCLTNLSHHYTGKSAEGTNRTGQFVAHMYSTQCDVNLQWYTPMHF